MWIRELIQTLKSIDLPFFFGWKSKKGHRMAFFFVAGITAVNCAAGITTMSLVHFRHFENASCRNLKELNSARSACRKVRSRPSWNKYYHEERKTLCLKNVHSAHGVMRKHVVTWWAGHRPMIVFSMFCLCANKSNTRHYYLWLWRHALLTFSITIFIYCKLPNMICQHPAVQAWVSYAMRHVCHHWCAVWMP